MPPLRVPEDVLNRLRAMRADRDRLALMAGVATIEWRQRMDAIEHSVERSRGEQRTLGQEVLVAFGLDLATRELDIDLDTGLVRELVAGEWTALEPEGATRGL